jgi:hypothetical protein
VYLNQGDRETARQYFEEALALAAEANAAREAAAGAVAAAGDAAAAEDAEGEDADDDAEEDEPFDTAPIIWAMEYIKAFDEPVTVPADHLEKIAGDYGARHFQHRDGALWYLRDGVSRTEYNKLTPISKDVYVMEGVIYFRMQFEYDDAGNPTKVVGMYDSGYRDESVRD